MTRTIVLNCFECPRLKRRVFLLDNEENGQMTEEDGVTVLTPREATLMLLRQRYAGLRIRVTSWYRISES